MKPLTAVCRFEMGGREYYPGDSVEASEAAAQRLLALGYAREEPAANPLPLADALTTLAEPPAKPKGVSRKALAVCSTPGCPELVERGKCRGCRSKANAGRRPAKRPYDAAAWRRTRNAFLAANPYCMCPTHAALPLIVRPLATEVDHVDGLGPLGPRGHDPANLQSLTKACHSRKTARDYWS